MRNNNTPTLKRVEVAIMMINAAVTATKGKVVTVAAKKKLSTNPRVARKVANVTTTISAVESLRSTPRDLKRHVLPSSRTTFA